MTTRTRLGAAVLSLSLMATAGGCSGAEGQARNTISYWLWDSSQQPAYQKCADAFHRRNPQLTVKITQYGWSDYWSKLTAGFLSDTAPDVFTNHLAKYSQFVDLNVLQPLDELGPTKSVRDSDYQRGLAALWKGEDGHRYGTPKDWDTTAFFYNRNALRSAGITAKELSRATWNPTNGGTFEKILAHLTLDSHGRRGDEPGFDEHHVKRYGLASGGSGGTGWGQTQWAPFAASTGWRTTDKNPWGTRFNLNDRRFQKTLSWYFGLVDKGFLPSYRTVGNTTAGSAVTVSTQVQTGAAALALDGSWMLSSYAKLADAKGRPLKIGIAPTPVGPVGKRASMFNGLGDSVTRKAKNPQAAAKWVAFLAGRECQDIVGRSGVVFPARPSGTALATAFNQKVRGFDVTPFTRQVKERTTFLYPVTKHPADVTALTGPAFDAVYTGDQPVSSLTDLNNQLNRLFEVVGP